MRSKKKPVVALLVGGTSPEREVSKLSGYSIYKALISLGYKTVLVDPAYGKYQPKKIDDFFSKKNFSALSNTNYVEAINSKVFDNIDIAFLALHGKWGEDGTIQSLLELKGIKYTGSNIVTSAIAMDKLMSKILFKHYDINTPLWIVVENNDAETVIKKKIKKNFGYPCVVKPNDQGSTVGLTICKSAAGLSEALKLAKKFSNRVLIEEYISGHEVTVGVLDNKPLPVLEIKPKHEVYDYRCKYTSGMSLYEVPAHLPETVQLELQAQALKAYNALGCKAYARMDFRLSNEYKTYCLEANTLPGMTSTSLVPKMAKAIGISFEELVDKIINLSY
ncbi:MAG: D-alanine--D-alanine ligase [Ignavibacteriaceae bacterium]|jgi:D-alanine-D-alanine ligase